jgi:hypothetical protein
MPALPDRADGVDDPTGGEVEARGQTGLARRAVPDCGAGSRERGSGGPVDGAADAATGGEALVRRVHDGVGREGGDVGTDGSELHGFPPRAVVLLPRLDSFG